MSKLKPKLFINIVTDGKSWVHQLHNIRVGDFALCSNNELGLVLWQTICTEKRTNKKYILYHGVNLTGKKIGLNWQSRNPKKVSKTYVRRMFSPQVTKDKK